MSELLFSSSTANLNRFMMKLRKVSYESQFSNERNVVIHAMIESILRYTTEWDENTKITAAYIGAKLISKINSALNTGNETTFESEDDLDDIFSLLFRFSLEMDLTARGEIEFDLNNIKSFALKNKQSFCSSAAGQIDYAMTSLPLGILKGIINSTGFRKIDEFIGLLNDSQKERDAILEANETVAKQHSEEVERKEKEWDSYIIAKQKEVDDIRKSLESYQTAFNFVGLHDGFKQLSEQKIIEKEWALKFVKTLGGLVFLPLVIEIIFTIFSSNKINNFYDAIYLIPVFSITFILIYYFRIALQNLNSINAQLSQIELRKTLCQFIQSYGEYSKKMKSNDSESLSKFENIIFSGIITNGDNIPSTFDGLEHIVKLVSDFKK